MRAKPIAVILALLSLPSCNMLQSNKFEITNGTERELRDVRISFADATATHQSLGPGETFSFKPSPDHDGGISVSYMDNGKRIEHELGYAAPPISMTCEFMVTGNDLRGDCVQN